MLTKNLDVSKGLVNGARGVVTKFVSNLSGKTSFAVFSFYTVFLLF